MTSAAATSLPYDAELLEAQAALAWSEERLVLAQLGLGGHVLDAGCGSGALVERLAQLSGVERLTGVDVDTELLAAARGRFPEGEFVEARAEALPFADDSFDGAVVRLVLQHVADPEAVARELARVVRPGGLVVAIDVDGGLWGLAQPHLPELEDVQARAWQARGGGQPDRMIGRRLHRILAAGGLVDVALRPYAYHSDALGLDAFEPVLTPELHLPAVESGALSLTDYGQLVRGHARFRSDPDAFVLLVGMLAAGIVPH